MKRLRVFLLCITVCAVMLVGTGCWNYREVDDFSIVAGAAVDKSETGNYILTAELIQLSGGTDTETTSKLAVAEGKTLFDAARTLISITGKKLYWSHAKVLIISQEIAEEGIDKIIDWYRRDVETREDTYILLSKEDTAKEVFDVETVTEDIKCFELANTLENERSLSKAPAISIMQYTIDADSPGNAAIIPTIFLKKGEDPLVSVVEGCAVIKNNRLIGFLNSEETEYLSLIRNEIKGGLILHEMSEENEEILLSLEIMRNKTEVSPRGEASSIEMFIDVDMAATLGEVIGTQVLDTEDGQEIVEESAEVGMAAKIKALVAKVQDEFGADIFKFGSVLRECDFKTYREVENNWDEVFKQLSVDVYIHLHIKNSGIIYGEG